MGKEKNSKDGNPPKTKDKSIVQKKKKLKTTATLLNNNEPNSDHGLSILVSSGRSTRSPSKHQKCETSNHKSRSSKYKHNMEPQSSSSNSEDITMEWEPVTEKEIIDTLHEIRRDFSTRTTLHPIANLTKKFESATSASVRVVVDTNVFLSHLPIVQMLVEKEEFCSKVQILVPWMVLQELDFMKTNRENKVKLEILARKAGTFIYEQRKNAFFRVQTIDEFKSCINLLPDENADDKILQWCLSLEKEIGSITLLSNDILFCAKASANGIQPFQSEHFMQQLPQLIAQSSPQQQSCSSSPNPCVKDLRYTSEISSSKKPSISSHLAYQQKRPKEPEVICAATFLQQFEESIVDSLSQILEYEMKQVYEDLWLQIIIVKPPWRLPDIFRCVDKHWIAVFGYVYPREMREKMDHLSDLWKRFKAQNVLEQKDTETIAQSGICIIQLIQRTRKQFHSTLEKAVEGIKKLLNQNADLDDDVFVMDLFTRLWDRFNFICGTLADAVGLPHHGLQYLPGATVPSPHEASNGFRLLMPLLCSMESAMSRFFQNSNGSSLQIESSSLEISNLLVQSARDLGLQLRKTSLPLLSRALTQFASNAEHRLKMEIGLEQLRVYIQVLHSVSIKFQLVP